MDKYLRTFLASSAILSSLLLGSSALAQPPTPKLADYFGFLPLELYKLDTRIGNLLLADLDGDKIDDIIVSNNGRSRIDLLLTTKKPADDKASRPFRKDPNELEYDRRLRLSSITVNKEVVSIETGDFNGDGKPDLVFYGTPAELTILYNDGKAGFSESKKIPCGDLVQKPSAVAVGDLDQDGRDDIAMLGDKELVFIYQTSTGVLSEPERVPHTASAPWLLKVIDIDGDKAKDLVIVDTEGDHPIHVRFATDEKKLGPEQRFALDMPSAIAFGQMDGKGGSEILVVEGQSGRARVLSLDQSAADDSNKRGRLAFFALPQGNDRGRSTDVGDLNGDKRQDVIVTDPANAQVWVYLQTGHSGLSSGQTFPSLGNARTVRILHGADGLAEVYVLSEQEKQIGRSTFENGRLSFPAPLAIEGDPVAMDVADLDGDKTPEIVYVSRHVGHPKPGTDVDTFELRAVTREAGGEMKAKRWGQGASVELAGVTSVPAAIKAIDINQDGRSDLLLFKDYGAPPVLVLSEKDGPPRLFTASLGPLSTAKPAGVSTINLGGPATLVAQNTFARRVLLESDGLWKIKDQYNAGRNSAQILGAAALDTDGDGTKEVVLLDQASRSLLFLSSKDGVYRPSGNLSLGSINFAGMHVADLDSDGRDDLLIAGTDRFGVLQTGRQGQRLKSIATYETKRTDARLGDLAAGDVNGDGTPDVVFTDVAEQSIEIASYAGDPELLPGITFKLFERKSFRNAAEGSEPRDMAIGDVDGDRRSDIVLIIHDRVLVLRQDPGGTGAKPGGPASKPATVAVPK
jgi:hypothetical protein